MVENNESIGNRDTGIVLFESHRNTVRNNEVRNNRHRIRLSLGSEDNVIEGNQVTDNTESGLYFY